MKLWGIDSSKKQVRENLVEERIKRSNEKFRDLDEQFRKTDIKDTETYIGVWKNQPLWAFKALQKYVWQLKKQKPELAKDSKNHDTFTEFYSGNIFRVAELVGKETSDYWKLQTNFYLNIISDVQGGLQSKEAWVDFMLRTKSFCFANQNLFAPVKTQVMLLKSDNFMENFFRSEVLPQELRFEFKDYKTFSEIYSKCNELKKEFDLNSAEFSSLLGNFMGTVFSESIKDSKNLEDLAYELLKFERYDTDKQLAKDIVNNNILKKIKENPDVDNFIFDLTFGSRIATGMQTLTRNDTENSVLMEKVMEKCLEEGMYNSAYISALKRVYDYPEKIETPDIDNMKNLFLEQEKTYQKKIEAEDKLKPERNLIYISDEEEIDNLLFHKVLESDDPVDTLLSLSTPKENGENIAYIFDPDIFEQFSKIKSAEEMDKLTAVYFAAFPYLIGANFYFDGNRGHKRMNEIIQKYLEYGGSFDKTDELDKYGFDLI